jgi:predicted transcriptional regulator
MSRIWTLSETKTDYQFINSWGNMITLRRKLMKDDELYLDELFLLSLIYSINRDKPAVDTDLRERFNILSYQRIKMMDNLTVKGYVKDDRPKKGHFKPHKYIVTPLGEQLLIKYEKVMQRLCEGSK